MLIREPQPKGVVILFHGYFASKSENLGYAREFHKLGYSTFLVDFMGSGGSTGNQTTVGFKESRDVKEAYHYIRQQFPEQDVILFGSSMGAVSILKAIHDYQLGPDKIIIECPFGKMKTTVEKRFETMGVPSFLLADLLMFYGGVQNDFNTFGHNPTKYAKAVDMPCLLLYGEQDTKVTRSETDAIFKNLKGVKKLQTFPKSGHQNYLINSRKPWIKAVSAFLDEAL